MVESVVVDDEVPAAFGRLCVETIALIACSLVLATQPPSGGCVLKQTFQILSCYITLSSRLRAAVC